TVAQPPRIAPLAELPDELRQLYAPQPQRYGDRPKPLLILMLAHNPAVARRFRPVPPEERRLSDREQELVILRTAWLCKVPFIWGEHVRLAHAAGMTAEEIERVTVGSAAAGWTEHEAALL